MSKHGWVICGAIAITIIAFVVGAIAIKTVMDQFKIGTTKTYSGKVMLDGREHEVTIVRIQNWPDFEQINEQVFTTLTPLDGTSHTIVKEERSGTEHPNWVKITFTNYPVADAPDSWFTTRNKYWVGYTWDNDSNDDVKATQPSNDEFHAAIVAMQRAFDSILNEDHLVEKKQSTHPPAAPPPSPPLPPIPTVKTVRVFSSQIVHDDRVYDVLVNDTTYPSTRERVVVVSLTPEHDEPDSYGLRGEYSFPGDRWENHHWDQITFLGYPSASHPVSWYIHDDINARYRWGSDTKKAKKPGNKLLDMALSSLDHIRTNIWDDGHHVSTQEQLLPLPTNSDPDE